MAKLGKATVEITGNLKPLRNALKTARKVVVRSAKRIGRLGFRAMSRAVRRAGRAVKRFARTLTVVLVAAIGASITAAVKFQKQLAMVNTMLSDAARASGIMQKYGKELRALSREFGQSTAVLTKGMFDILSAQIPATEALEFLVTTTKAAVAGMTDTATATKLIITLMKSYGFETNKVGEVSDKVFATVKQGLTTFEELSGALGRVAGTAAIAGMSFEEMLALTATATRGLGNTNEAVTSIIGVLRAFLNPQEDAIEAAKEFGLVLNTTTLREEGFLGAVKKLNKATPEQLSTIVGNIRGFKALAVALKDTAGFEKDLAAIAVDSAGRMKEAFEIMADTASFELGQLQQETVDLGRVFGTALLPPFRKFIGLLKKEISTMRSSVEGSFNRIKTSGEAVVATIIKVLDRVKEYVAIAKDPKKGLTEAFTLMFKDLEEIFTKGWAIFKKKVLPVVKEVGAAFGDAFTIAFGERLDKRWREFGGGIPRGLAIGIGATGEKAGQAITAPFKFGGNIIDITRAVGELSEARKELSRQQSKLPVGSITNETSGGI